MAFKKDFDLNKIKIKLPKNVKFQQAIEKFFKKNQYTKIMAGESATIRNTGPDGNTSKSPKFISDETEFVGSGVIRTSTPLGKHRRSRSRSGTRITPGNLSVSDEHFYEDLEEYVREMSTTREPGPVASGPQEPDVWAQLQQKESDLLLAAELGKALLDKNEELKKEQDRVAEEYSKKVELAVVGQ
ncbi:Uncharacterized protein OBRU01_06052 [Operophtera brumata]|uniref:Uncharacterized protein n=1 Tax=Operophtera brumata TaxID=104452 RepID=A0A0L7LMC6_OPEBR|nr:Uncharacterized protein OBRU01_06052 [Operophtera brumata]